MKIIPTVQDRIIAELVRRVGELKNDEDVPSKLFNRVINGEISEVSPTAWPICGIYQGNEVTIDHMFPVIDKVVAIYFEFRFSKTDVDSYMAFRYYLGKLQAILFGPDPNPDLSADRVTLGGLTSNVQEMGNQPQIEGPNDTGPGGVLVAEIRYRYFNGNPFKLISEV